MGTVLILVLVVPLLGGGGWGIPAGGNGSKAAG